MKKNTFPIFTINFFFYFLFFLLIIFFLLIFYFIIIPFFYYYVLYFLKIEIFDFFFKFYTELNLFLYEFFNIKKFFNFNDLFIFFIASFKLFLKIIFKLFIKIYYIIKSLFYKILIKKQHLFMKYVFRNKGLPEFFELVFLSPNFYRIFSFYVFFLLFYVSLDWIEHFLESIDKNDSEFELDFEDGYEFQEDPNFGKSFFFSGQRLSLERTSEQPDFYKSNDDFFQPKRSKFSLYNREFLGGLEDLNIINIFSEHETFNLLGSYEFFGPSFIVIFISYETDIEFDFFFAQNFIYIYKFIFPQFIFDFFSFENTTAIINDIILKILYLPSLIFLIFKINFFFLFDVFFKYYNLCIFILLLFHFFNL